MDDAFCFRALYAICIHMGHNVVADKTFSFFCHIIIDVLCMCFQFLDLLVCNVQSKLFFCLSKCDPEFLQVRNFISGEKMYCISLLA